MDSYSMNSMNNNCISKIFSSNERTNDDPALSEESGWTMYFDDFFNQHNETSCFSSALESSLISDAAFSAVKNNFKAADDDNEQVIGFSRENPCDRFISRKRKTKILVFDDDLEDTASSPANSPKVCNLISEYYDRKPDQNSVMDISQEKASSSAQMDHHERSAEGASVGRDHETELKKRGLCLVPLSMIVDYFG